MRLSNQRGFTLTEILVVIGVVAILAAIAIPQYMSARGRAADTMVVSAVRAVATGEEAYFASHQTNTSDVASLSGVGIGAVSITIENGNSGSLASSFRVIGMLPGASHGYMFTSDPGAGGSNMSGTFLESPQS